MELKKHELQEALDLALWAGELMFRSGAEIDKVNRAITSMLTGTGCDNVSTLVAHNALMVTISRAGECQTKVRPIHSLGVDFTKLSELFDLAMEVQQSGYDSVVIRRRLTRIQNARPIFSMTSTSVAVSIACGAFAVIFGGHAPEFFATAASTFLGAMVRFSLAKMRFNVFIVFAASAFVATLAAMLCSGFVLKPNVVQSAAVLYLIPGVPLIDSVEDLIRGYVTVGLTRGVMGLLMILFLASGMYLALSLRSVF
ncbi:threonine/serine ThrE exporter family protein [Desulfovibrio inopinatus]|uniref:threonine/serine ThrE exporter family protein n=1 Tax=Desulfovibrio inopinatus TaxID=102109 RepID=UPI00041E5240|nr:threonine/serine exporter family protein [Desulfovibrio inopinatus]